jgi:hypothetical protein
MLPRSCSRFPDARGGVSPGFPINGPALEEACDHLPQIEHEVVPLVGLSL